MTMVGAQKRNPFGDHISSALIILLKSNSADFIILSKIFWYHSNNDPSSVIPGKPTMSLACVNKFKNCNYCL